MISLRDKIKRLSAGKISTISNTNVCPLNCFKSETKWSEIIEAGTNARTPASTTNPPLTTSFTVPSTCSWLSAFAWSSSQTLRASTRRFESKKLPFSLSLIGLMTTKSNTSPTFTTSSTLSNGVADNSLKGITPSTPPPIIPTMACLSCKTSTSPWTKSPTWISFTISSASCIVCNSDI